MTILVTGANGFIGSKLCEYLLKEGHTVRGLVRQGSNHEFINDLKGLEIFVGDISDIETLRKPIKGVKVVYHIAAFTLDWGPWDTFVKYNINGVANVMEAALEAGVKKVVHTSSVSIYGFPPQVDIPEEGVRVERPNDPYVNSKLEGEQVALSYNSKKMGVTVVRPAGVYGPNDRTTSLRVLPEIQKGSLPYIDKGKYYMAPVYIDNLIQGMVKAADSAKSGGEAYNIADAGYMTWKEYFDSFAKEMGVKPPKFSIPGGLAKFLAASIEGIYKVLKIKNDPPLTNYRINAVTADHHYSIEKAAKEIGYKPKISTEEGIKRTAVWFLNYQKEMKSK